MVKITLFITQFYLLYSVMNIKVSLVQEVE